VAAQTPPGSGRIARGPLQGNRREAECRYGIPQSACSAGGFHANVLPIVEIAVTAAEPGHGNQVDLFILVQPADDLSQFRPDRVVGVIFQRRQHGVIACIRAGIRIGGSILNAKPAALARIAAPIDSTQMVFASHR